MLYIKIAIWLFMFLMSWALMADYNFRHYVKISQRIRNCAGLICLGMGTFLLIFYVADIPKLFIAFVLIILGWMLRATRLKFFILKTIK